MFDQNVPNNDLITLTKEGVNFCFFKDEEYDDFLLNLDYIITDISFNLKRYATAKNQKLNLIAQHPIILESIDNETIEVNSDICPSIECKPILKIGLSDELNEFTIESCERKISNHLNYINQLSIKIPLRETWDSTEEKMSKDTLDTWIELNTDKFTPKKNNILLINDNIRSNSPFLFGNEFSNTIIHHETNLERVIGNFSGFDFSLVFFQSINNDYTEENFEKLLDIIKSKKNDKIILFLFNVTSTSEAFRKVYNFQNIICSKSPLDPIIFKNILSKFDSISRQGEDIKKYFGETVPFNAQIGFPINLSSLSESLITFTCDFEIPFFTVLVIDLPLKIMTTIIPPTHELENIYKKFHYMGMIHGISYQDKKDIRKFVNWLIFYPLLAERENERKEFFEKNKEVKEVLEKSKEEIEDNAIIVNEEAQTDKKENKPDYKKGKSKL